MHLLDLNQALNSRGDNGGVDGGVEDRPAVVVGEDGGVVVVVVVGGVVSLSSSDVLRHRMDAVG